MKLIHNAIFFGLAIGTVSMVGCSSTPQSSDGPSASTSPSGNEPGGQHGTIGLALNIGAGLSLGTVQYTITNPSIAGFTPIVNSVDVSGSTTINFSLTLPVGTGYTLSLSAIDSSGDPCSGGPVTFSVVGGQSNAVSLNLVCSRTIDSGVDAPDVNIGIVIVTGDASLETTTASSTCAAASSLSVSPGETAIGHAISLSAVGIDPSNQTSAVTITWAATGGAGSLTSTTGTSTTFNCTSGGTETLVVTASIANGGASCAGTGSITTTVVCDGPGAVVDAGTPVDSGTPVVDSGTPVVDAGTPVVDSGTPVIDSGAPAPLLPCTTAGQANCVQCVGNDKGAINNKTCTPTEAQFVQHDIDTGKATVAGADPAGSCYDCLWNNACIDDTHFGDDAHECGDTAALTSFGTAAECQATVGCILGSSCASSALATCYCGTAGLLTTCQGNPASGPINGACASTIAAGLGFAVTDGTDNTGKLNSTTYASGMADQIFQCALSNSCTACQ
jgi:hypothetical protein